MIFIILILFFIIYNEFDIIISVEGLDLGLGANRNFKGFTDDMFTYVNILSILILCDV